VKLEYRPRSNRYHPERDHQLAASGVQMKDLGITPEGLDELVNREYADD
jgi:hypothetical protein